jgi:hypothetical protein
MVLFVGKTRVILLNVMWQERLESRESNDQRDAAASCSSAESPML